jgi:hypothetical protein
VNVKTGVKMTVEKVLTAVNMLSVVLWVLCHAGLCGSSILEECIAIFKVFSPTELHIITTEKTALDSVRRRLCFPMECTLKFLYAPVYTCNNLRTAEWIFIEFETGELY